MGCRRPKSQARRPRTVCLFFLGGGAVKFVRRSTSPRKERSGFPMVPLRPPTFGRGFETDQKHGVTPKVSFLAEASRSIDARRKRHFRSTCLQLGKGVLSQNTIKSFGLGEGSEPCMSIHGNPFSLLWGILDKWNWGDPPAFSRERDPDGFIIRKEAFSPILGIAEALESIQENYERLVRLITCKACVPYCTPTPPPQHKARTPEPTPLAVQRSFLVGCLCSEPLQRCSVLIACSRLQHSICFCFCLACARFRHVASRFACAMDRLV